MAHPRPLAVALVLGSLALAMGPWTPTDVAAAGEPDCIRGLQFAACFAGGPLPWPPLDDAGILGCGMGGPFQVAPEPEPIEVEAAIEPEAPLCVNNPAPNAVDVRFYNDDGDLLEAASAPAFLSTSWFTAPLGAARVVLSGGPAKGLFWVGSSGWSAGPCLGGSMGPYHAQAANSPAPEYVHVTAIEGGQYLCVTNSGKDSVFVNAYTATVGSGSLGGMTVHPGQSLWYGPAPPNADHAEFTTWSVSEGLYRVQDESPFPCGASATYYTTPPQQPPGPSTVRMREGDRICVFNVGPSGVALRLRGAAGPVLETVSAGAGLVEWFLAPPGAATVEFAGEQPSFGQYEVSYRGDTAYACAGGTDHYEAAKVSGVSLHDQIEMPERRRLCVSNAGQDAVAVRFRGIDSVLASWGVAPGVSVWLPLSPLGTTHAMFSTEGRSAGVYQIS